MEEQRAKRIAYTNARISFAVRCLEELKAIGPLETGINDRLSSAQRSRRWDLVSELHAIYRQFDPFLPIAVSGDSAFVNTESLLGVYCDEVLPYRDAIHDLYYEDPGPARAEPRSGAPGPLRNADLVRFYDRAVAELQESFGGDSYREFYESFRFPEDVVHEVTLVERMGLFRPDDWIENNDYLLPVVTQRPVHKIPFRVRHSLDEIYDMFRLGQWRACVALSRALLELVLVNEKRLFEGPVYREDASGRRWPRRIGELVEMAGASFPELSDAMQTIVQWANQTLHPGRGNAPLQELDRVERTWALECVAAIRLICERIYF
jgi:hypothetical protein